MKKLLVVPIFVLMVIFSSCGKNYENYRNIYEAVNKADLKAVKDFVLKDPTLVNSTDDQGVSILICSISKTHPDISMFLVENGADVNFRDPVSLSKDYTPLHWAARMGYKDLTLLLLEKGADINAVSKSGETPLHLTVSKGRIEIAEILISKGANLTLKDLDGLTPLDRAEKNGNSDFVRILKEAMKSPNIGKEKGEKI